MINKDQPQHLTARENISYTLPNTIESLGIELLINGVYEEHLIRFLNKQVKAGDIFFDAGANIGSIGLPVCTHVSNIKYLAFEASPNVFGYLQKNFKQNGFSEARLFNFLLHEGSGQELPFYASVWHGKNSLAPTYTKEAIMLKTKSLDDFCSEESINRINWMKVDVQGFELFVFKGMRHMLETKRVDNIIFEFEYWAEEAAGLEKGAAQRYLSDAGYQLYHLNGKPMKEVMTIGRSLIWAKREGIA